MEPMDIGVRGQDPMKVRLRFTAQILGAEAVDLDARNAVQAIQGSKELAAYKVMMVAVLPEGDAGSLLALGKGHSIVLETQEDGSR